MKGFIEVVTEIVIDGCYSSLVPEDTQKRIINTRHVTMVNPFQEKTAIVTSFGNTYIVSESYDEIKKKLEEATD